VNTKWKAEATTVAGGNSPGSELNQFRGALSIDIDHDDESIYITDSWNDRIMKWKLNGSVGEIAAGGNGKGERLDQLSEPRDAIVEKKSHSLVICDSGNQRVIKWILGTKTGQQVIIANIICWGLAWDSIGDLYVSDWANHQIIRWKQVYFHRTVVAGGNGPGGAFNQLNLPRIIFVDQFGSIYIADFVNARIMKWEEDQTEGNLLVDFQTITNYDDRETRFASVFVDLTGNVYFSDANNCHISRWSPGRHKGTIIAGGDGCDNGAKGLTAQTDFGFDRQGNLYVVDGGNHRIQKFARDLH
jgi:sugar lactone lactonase YvrE